jgi:uncharacterized membrane protein YgcG
MAFIHLKIYKSNCSVKSINLQSNKKKETPKLKKTCIKMNLSKFDNFSQKNVKKFLPIFISLNLIGSPFLVDAVPEQKPTTNVVDESGSLTKSSISFIQKSLSNLKEAGSGDVYFVSIRSLPFEQTPQEYAKELFDKWGLTQKDVVVVLANKIAKAGIYYGNEVNSLSEKTVKSIGEETYSFKAKEEQYGSAAIDVNNRLVSILSNKGDPGPPQINRNNTASNFKSAKKTEEQRSKYIAIIVILLVIAFVVPMFQFFWYVKDE